MLDTNSLKAVVPLAQDLSEHNVRLTVAPDTPLAVLVREVPTIGIDPTLATFDSLIKGFSELSADSDHHDLLCDEIEKAKAAVRTTLNFSRNVVNPHIRRVVARVDAIMESYAEGKPPVEFRYVYLPEVYDTHAGRSLVESWANTPSASSPGALNFGNYSAEEILELSQVTNDNEFNENIRALLVAKNGEGVRQISEVLNGTRNVSKLDDIYSLPCSLVFKAIEQPKEGVGMTLSNYNSNRVLIANVAGRAAFIMTQRVVRAIKDKTLYYSLVKPAEGEVVEIYGEVWAGMLEESKAAHGEGGLSAEALIGNELLGRPYRGVALMDPANISRCHAAYERDRNVRSEAAEQDRARHLQRAISSALRDDLHEIAEKGEFTIEGDDKERAWVRLKDVVDKIMDSPQRSQPAIFIIAAALCVTWYAHTNAALFMDIMLDIEKRHPGMPETEFDFLATVTYITRWVVSQVEVVGA